MKSYHDYRREIIRLKNAILFNENGVGELNIDTGKTQKRIKHMENIVNAIDDVYNSLPKEKQRLVLVAYWTKPQTMTWEGIALNLHCGARTVYRWRDEIIETIADAMGWF